MTAGRALETFERLVQTLLPGGELRRVAAFGVDQSDDSAITKAVGYGKPLLVEASAPGGEQHRWVFHTASANAFGHDRRSDRAAEMLLAFDTFGTIPQHTRALDVGVLTPEGKPLSLRNGGEFYLVTSFAPGKLYAEELARAAESKRVGELEKARARQLARYLVNLHAKAPHRAAPVAPNSSEIAYTRSTRDLVGSGEGIFGIIDGYPQGTANPWTAQLRRIEAACVGWRWRLKPRAERLRTIHGDFHPFNLLFDEHGALTLLDASRGCQGDPADDVSCLAVNYVFFALGHPGAWEAGFRELWLGFWREYLDGSRDREIFEVVAPYLTWRLLVLANPSWYSGLSDEARGRLLDFAESALAAEAFSVDLADPVFA